MRVPDEPVCIDLFRSNPVFTSLHLKYTVHVVQPQGASAAEQFSSAFVDPFSKQERVREYKKAHTRAEHWRIFASKYLFRSKYSQNFKRFSHSSEYLLANIRIQSNVHLKIFV
jgi:hypothetical protein